MKSVLTTLVMLTLFWQPEPQATHYSTCPQGMEKLNTGYVEIDSAELLKYAKVRVQPQTPQSCRCEGKVRVEIMVQRDRAFCATALDGHPLLQEAAVKAAMQWRFKKNRPPFKRDIYGVLTFDFKALPND